MAIVGVGTDVVEIDRFAAALERRPRLAERCFTPAVAESRDGEDRQRSQAQATT